MKARIKEKEIMENAALTKSYHLLSDKYLTSIGYKEVLKCFKQNKFAGEKILDLGCGSGSLTLYLAKIYTDWSFIGIDLSRNMLELAEEKLRKLNLPETQCRFIYANAQNLPFSKTNFDAVISFASLHHWDNPKIVIKEALRVLKNKGLLAIFDLKRDKNILRFKKTIPSEEMQQLFADSLAASYKKDELDELIKEVNYEIRYEIIENNFTLGIIAEKNKCEIE
jgi:ubiquinone/menaquinone biosynthesis C-methylase UbiE